MNFNLSAWALKNRQIVLYIMLLLGIVGAISYTKLGQSEDPPFTFKAMVIRTNWPGASAEEVSARSPSASRRSSWRPANTTASCRSRGRASRR